MHLFSHLAEINTAERFMEARRFVKEYGMQRLKRELIAPGYVEKTSGQLTTGLQPFNVFARYGAGLMRPNESDQAALRRADPEYAERFIVCRNLPANDEQWENPSPKWVGRSSMAKIHRFLVIRKPPDDKASASREPDSEWMDLFWTWFNVVTFGMVDVDPRHENMDVDEVQKLESNTKASLEQLKAALKALRTMRKAAYGFVEQDAATSGWSLRQDGALDIGLYFHCYPHCSVNSLHLHIVDLANTGPTYDACKHKNLCIDDVIEGLEREIRAIEQPTAR